MIQQYFCVRKGSQFLRALVGNCIGLFGLSVDVDERRGAPIGELSYPEGSRVSLKLDPYDTFMLEAMRKKHNASITDVFRHSLRVAFYLQFGMTLPEAPLTIELQALGLASLEEMEFGAGAQDDSGEPAHITPQLRRILFGSADPHEATRLRVHTSPERDGSSPVKDHPAKAPEHEMEEAGEVAEMEEAQ